MISIVFNSVLLAYSMFLIPVVFALLYSVQGGDAQIKSKRLSNCL